MTVWQWAGSSCTHHVIHELANAVELFISQHVVRKHLHYLLTKGLFLSVVEVPGHSRYFFRLGGVVPLGNSVTTRIAYSIYSSRSKC